MKEMQFKRDIYDKMLAWKLRRETHATPQSLEISGARQVGKTVVLNTFAEENYEQVVSIHLDTREDKDILQKWEQDIPELLKTLRGIEYVEAFLRRFNPQFVDSPRTVIIIDEI